MILRKVEDVISNVVTSMIYGSVVASVLLGLSLQLLWGLINTL